MNTTKPSAGSRQLLTAGLVCLLLTPLVTMAADIVRMMAERSGALVGMVSGTGADQTAAMFATIEANLGTYQLASWLALAAAIVAIPGVAAVRTLTADRSPRWSMAALITGICLVIGEFVHLMGYYAWNQILVAFPDREAAIAVSDLTQQNVFGLVVFSPYLIGVLLFWPFAAVALWRSRAIPIWAFVLVLVGGLVMTVAGSSYLTSPVWAIATTVGLAPALVTQLRSARTAANNSAMAATEVSTSSSVVR
ncbi:hypothetical protein [Microlunatus phosphovorus]|nr:hypothetical protein [Microlunatus phosphovorus]